MAVSQRIVDGIVGGYSGGHGANHVGGAGRRNRPQQRAAVSGHVHDVHRRIFVAVYGGGSQYGHGGRQSAATDDPVAGPQRRRIQNRRQPSGGPSVGSPEEPSAHELRQAVPESAAILQKGHNAENDTFAATGVPVLSAVQRLTARNILYRITRNIMVEAVKRNVTRPCNIIRIAFPNRSYKQRSRSRCYRKFRATVAV